MANILAIHAHPDDVEFLAGGTMALLAGLGHALTIATFTPGDCGSKQMGPDEIAAVRRQEASHAAALIGARYFCLEMRDLAIFDDDASRRLVTETLRQTRPDLVLTASPVDYHCDHEAVSALVRDACFAAPAPNYQTRAAEPAPPLDQIPYLYFMDPAEGTDREGAVVEPHFVVDIEPVFARKHAMLAAHASQRIWLKEHHGTDDYLETMERWTRARGALASLPLGEGFRQYKGHAYPQNPLLEECLGTAAVKFRK
jgi:LmbE family N-acetylglucosaminyl deacetylase